MEWSTACPDWEERIVAGATLVPIAPLFPAKADEGLGVFKSLQVTDLPRKPDGTWPTLGECCDQRLLDLVAAIFGAEDPISGKRLIREFLLLISKKNIKSTLAAGIMVAALIINWRDNAELMILAPTLEVANNSFGPAMGMVRADPELQIILKVIEHQRQIRHLDTGAVLSVVAADSDTAAGKKAGMVLVEELWLFGKKPKSAAMLREATGGLASRPEGFVLYITTHSDEPPCGVYKTKLAYFRDVRDGVIHDPSSLAVLFEWPESLIEAEAYLDPDMFYLTNPMIGRSVTREWLASELAKEQSGEGEGLQIFLAKHLNVEIGLRLRRDRWAGADYWLDNVENGLSLAELLRRSEVVTVGIDGGGLGDLFGLAVVGRERGSERWLCWTRAWGLPVVLERHKAVASRLQDFVVQGDLGLVDTTQEIVAAVAELLVEIRESGLLPNENAIGVDPSDIGALIDGLNARGFRSHEVDPATGRMIRLGQIEPVRQGVALTGAIHTAEFKLHDGLLVHGGSEMMAWCVSNAKAVQKGNAVAIDKEVAGSAKIDPLIALFCAVKLMELGPVAGVARVEPEVMVL
jgi:phage terminase large subunit-like protein